MKRIRVWDWPTRLTHWLLVALVVLSWGSAEYHAMELHRYSGYALCGLLVFRVYWGVVGSSTARFTQFVKGPRTVLRYLRASSESVATYIGHNPLGAWSVIILLLLLSAQVALGLFAVDIDGLESGPLSRWVSFDTGRAIAEAHETMFDVLLGFIVLHVGAILYYLLFKQNNLIAPMITGNQLVSADTSDPGVRVSLWRVVGGILLAAASVWLIV